MLLVHKLHQELNSLLKEKEVNVKKQMGSAGSNAKGQHGQRLFRAAVFSQLQLTLGHPAIPLQACVSEFWVRETATAT